jgi:hypothetical protein
MLTPNPASAPRALDSSPTPAATPRYADAGGKSLVGPSCNWCGTNVKAPPTRHAHPSPMRRVANALAGESPAT